MRDSGLTSVGPNCEKSTAGIAGRARAPVAAGGAPPAVAAPEPNAVLTNALTSSCVIRPLKPCPATRVRSTPSSRANLRAEGPACAREKPGSLIGGRSARMGVAPGCALSVSAGAGATAGRAAAATDTTAGAVEARVGSLDGGTARAADETGAAAAAGAARAGGGACDSGAASDRTVAMRSPAETLPPFATCTFSMTPLAVDGTSIVAFSVSSVPRGASGWMLSPGLTRTSITATSLKLPMSGTRTSTRRAAAFIAFGPSDFPGYGLGGIDAERLDRARDSGLNDLAIVRERLQRRDRDVVAIHFEVAAQRGSRGGTPESVGAERDVATADPLPDLVRDGAKVIGRGDDRVLAILEPLLHVRHARRLCRVQEVPALALEGLAPQFAEARDGEDVGRHAIVVLENLRGGEAFAQNRARAKQCGADLAPATRLQLIGPLENPRLHPGRHGRLRVVLVHHRDVIEDVLLLDIHAAHAVVDDDGELVGERRVIRDTVRHRGGDQLAVPVLVLQTFAGQRRASGRAAQQEAARLNIPRGPDEIPDSLEAEHRVENVERHHVDAVIAVGRAGGHPRAQRAGLVDAFLDHLALLVLAIGHEGLGVLRRVQLADRGIDP